MTQFSQSGSGSPFKFDWYQASLNVPVSVVAKALDQEPTLLGWGQEPGLHGYKFRREYYGSDYRRHVVMMFGGNGGRPNLKGSGSESENICRLIRSISPDHKVSRADSCIDYSAPGVFDELVSIAQTIATGSNPPIKTELIHDPLNPDAGATFYLGSKKSPVYICIYRKGYEQLAKGMIQRSDLDPHWVRVELRCRPVSRDMGRFTTASAEEVWGYSKFARKMLRLMENFEVEPIVRTARVQSELDRRVQVMFHQYGATMMELGHKVAVHEYGIVGPTNDETIEAFVDTIRGVLRADLDRGARFISSEGAPPDPDADYSSLDEPDHPEAPSSQEAALDGSTASEEAA